MKILIHGSNPWFENGMGKVGLEMAKGLSSDGHDVHYFASNVAGPERDHPPDHDDPDEVFTVHGQPNPGGPGVQMFGRKLIGLEPDLALTNRNWQGLDWMPETLNNIYMNHGNPIPLLMYGPPVETEEKPPLFKRKILEDHLNDVWMVPYTENRYEAMRDDWDVEKYLLPDDFDPTWVPHGVDTDIFYPGCAEDHKDDDAPGVRDGFNLGDRFVGLYIGENWRRKNLDVLMDSWRRFRDDVVGNGDERPFLMLHTDPGGTRGDDQFYSGWNIAKTAISYGLNVATDIRQVDERTDVVCSKPHTGAFEPREVVAAYLDVADVYCLPTSGEGFSLTSLEAMATGTPIVQTDVPTLRWLCQDAAEYVDSVQQHAINTGERMETPSVEGLHQTLCRVYADPDRCEEMADEGVHRAQAFTWGRMRDELGDVVDHIATTTV